MFILLIYFWPLPREKILIPAFPRTKARTNLRTNDEIFSTNERRNFSTKERLPCRCDFYDRPKRPENQCDEIFPRTNDRTKPRHSRSSGKHLLLGRLGQADGHSNSWPSKNIALGYGFIIRKQKNCNALWPMPKPYSFCFRNCRFLRQRLRSCVWRIWKSCENIGLCNDLQNFLNFGIPKISES